MNVPMTVQDIMDEIHIAYEQATDTPALTDDDGVIRLGLINKGINRWQFDNGVRWRELDILNATGPTIVAGTVTYDIPQDDFREFASKMRIVTTGTTGTTTTVNLVSPEYFRNWINANGLVQGYNSTNVACISGNPSAGYQLNLGWVPVATDNTVGGKVYYDYYKFADQMTSVSDVPEMSNPGFLIDYVVGELFVNDDVNLYTKFNGDALNDLAILYANKS